MFSFCSSGIWATQRWCSTLHCIVVYNRNVSVRITINKYVCFLIGCLGCVPGCDKTYFTVIFVDAKGLPEKQKSFLVTKCLGCICYTVLESKYFFPNLTADTG